MNTRREPFVKICCIASPAEAELAVRAGASALGLVSQMPSGPGVIPDERIAEIAAAVPPPVATFLLTARVEARAILAQQAVCRASVLQLVDTVPQADLRVLRAELPGVRLVQVIHVTGPESIAEARAVAPCVDALLLDSGNPNLPVKELGGTGRTHDWGLARAIRASVPLPLFLAGGLSEHNVRDALRTVEPFGLDLCSSVRTDGHLDPVKLERFFAAVRTR
ncbi:MAG: phosphoribosylanthranilate isomerase [Planctomycetes bacterium]|nr:phosphoribosylanthranilate isomerase [Planctomycetota bacterium]